MEINQSNRENIKVFHCNDVQRCEKFLKEDDYLIRTEENGIWLGSGMYFWDNLSNAKYWKREKKRKTHNRKSFSIVSAKIYIDDLLDLTDEETCRTIEMLWENYCRKMKRKYDVYKNVDLGEKLNTLFSSEMVKEHLSTYSVVKIIGKYPRVPPTSLYSYDVHSNKIEPTLSAKCIYTVKNANYIFDKKLVEE